MRLAVAGKGGAGKTTIAATISRVLARDGWTVLAIDADSNPNLATATGGAAVAEPFPDSIVSRRLHGPALTLSVDELLRAHTVAGPDGLRLGAMGAVDHAHEGCMCAAHATTSAVLDGLGARSDVAVVLDLEASPEHFSRGTARHVDTLGLVTEPYYRSLETTRRMAGLAAELPVPRVVVIANKVRSAADGEAIAEFCDRHALELAGSVPWSDAVLDADRARVPLADVNPADPALAAIAGLAHDLVGQPVRG